MTIGPTDSSPTALGPEEVDVLAELLAPLVAAKLEPSADRVSDVLLTPREAAQRAKVHVETIRRHVRSGTLRASRAGRTVRIAVTSLETWLAGGRDDESRPRAQRPRAGDDRRPLADALATLDAVDR